MTKPSKPEPGDALTITALYALGVTKEQIDAAIRKRDEILRIARSEPGKTIILVGRRLPLLKERN